MSVSVFSQVWKVSDVYHLRGDLGDADRPVLRRSPAWSEDASALYVDSLINGFPLPPLVVWIMSTVGVSVTRRYSSLPVGWLFQS